MTVPVDVASLGSEQLLVWSYDGGVFLMVATETIELTRDEARLLALALVDAGQSLTAPDQKKAPGIEPGA